MLNNVYFKYNKKFTVWKNTSRELIVLFLFTFVTCSHKGTPLNIQ